MQIEIPKELLDEFSRKDFGGDESDIDKESGSKTALKVAEKTFAWIAESFDSTMKEKGAPGLGKISSGDFSKLAIIAFEKELSAKIIEDMPKYAFGVACLSIAGANTAYLMRERRKKESESNSGNAGEQPDEVGSKAAKRQSETSINPDAK